MAPIPDCLSTTGVSTLCLPFNSKLEHSDDSTSVGSPCTVLSFPSDDSTSVGESTDSDLSFLSDEDSPKTAATPKAVPSQKATSGIVEQKSPQAIPGLHEQPITFLGAGTCSSSSSRLASSCDGASYDDEVLDRWWRSDGFDSSSSGSIEMVSLGPLTMQLSTNFKMYLQTHLQKPSQMESETESVFVRANRVTIRKDGTVLVSGILKHPEMEATTLECGLKDLLLDVRVAVDDEPAMVRIWGAQLKKGRLVRIFAEPGTGEISCVVHCKKSYETVSLTQVVTELRELELLRRDAKLLQYQRQLNAMMLGTLRRHRLGFESV